MLYQYTNDDGKVFNLAPHNNFTIESDNIFTTIVGQNGTGKSRLLESIIYETIEYEFGQVLERTALYKCNIEPNIIAISTSPFDKFPVFKKQFHEQPINYTYLGLKNLYSGNFGRSYLSKVMRTLISSLYTHPKIKSQ